MKDLLGFKVSRRAFLGGSVGVAFAFTIGISASPKSRAQTAKVPFNAYVSIAPDGTITIQSPAAEMGQGIMTGLPLIVAEELDADWSRVVVEQSPIDAAYHQPIFKAQYFVASLSTIGYWTPVRMAGAQARRVLLESVAARWNVPVAELSTEPSVVVHQASGRRIGYGEVATFVSVPDQMPVVEPKDLKTPDRYRLIGKGVARVDVPAKTNGSAKYGIDVRVPGMAYATLTRASVRGSGPVSSNADAIRKLPGVTDVVMLTDGVAIVGETFDAVRKARRQLNVTWRTGLPGNNVSTDKDFETFLGDARDMKRVGVVWKSQGDTAAALKGAAKVLTREFKNDPVYHAQMEPMNATAYVRPDGSADVWVGTQAPTRTSLDVAKALGIGPDKVRVHQQFIGGGFGRRAAVETSVEAAMVAKAVGKPVKLILSREDDLAGGVFRPMTVQKIDAGLDRDGKLVGWHHRVIGEPVGDFLYHPGYLKAAKDRDAIFMMGADLPYYDKVPNWIGEHVMEPERSRVAAWRGIGAGYTKFAVEAMLDELAHEHRIDPLTYRLSLTDVPRARRLLETVAQMSGWGRKRSGTALGIAFGDLGVLTPKIGSMIASVAEVSVNERTGRIRVHNYWAAADAGLAINPNALAMQIESATVWALSGALKERVSIRDGVVQQSNFHDYEILRMAEMPEIAVQIVSTGSLPTMAGELGVPPCAPAVGNAFFALTGKRLYHLPFTPQRVLAALKA